MKRARNRKWTVGLLLLAVVVLLGAVSAWATTYTVHPGGSIQAAINGAAAGDTIQVMAGTYNEALNVYKSVTIEGAGAGSVTINVAGKSGTDSSGIYVSAADVHLSGFTLVGTTTSAAPRYGIKYGEVSGGALDGIVVENIYRSGVDLLGSSNMTVSNLVSQDNGGHGIALTDCHNITVTNLTTSGNGWQAVSVATWGRYTPIGTSGIVFNGTLNLAEVFQLEQGRYPSGPPETITFSTDPAAGADVTVPATSFSYALFGDDDESPAYQRVYFFKTLADAEAVAAIPGQVGHLKATGRYIQSIVNQTQLYVSAGCSLQGAIGGAVSGDVINVQPGVYAEGPRITVDKATTIAGGGAASTTFTPAGNTGSSGDNRAWFLVDTGVTLHVSGMTFDGAGYKIYQAFRWKGDGSVANCDFRNIAYDPSSAYAGFALVPFGGNVDITGSSFENIGRVGVLYFGPGITGSTYSGNSYVGKGVGNWLDYGVEVGGGAHATIKDSAFRNNLGVASVDGSTSAGILVTTYYGDGTTATILNNVITNCTTGIAVGYNASDTSQVVAHYNSIAGNTDFGIFSTNPVVDATLNWWGGASGPSGAGTGTGDAVSANVIFSPWLGTNPDGNPTAPGVQVTGPVTIIVAPVGPEPTGGYMNTAIEGSNELPATDTIEVRHGTYDASTPITDPVNIVSETGSASHTTLTGNMSINGDGVLVGMPLQGFRVNGNVTVGAGKDAGTSWIHWCDLYGNVTNNGTGTFDAKYNYWGTQLAAVIDGRITGSVDYNPFLPENADASYLDMMAIIGAGLATGWDPAIEQLWLMVQLGQNVNTFIQYQGVAGAGAFQATLQGGQINLGGAAGGGGAVEGALSGTYTAGQAINGTFTITDPVTGAPITDAAVTLSLMGPDGSLAYWGCATFDASSGQYTYSIDTSGLAPGTYSLIIQSDDGQSQTITVEIQAP